ncbi:hypothetical protein SAMN04244579_03630 [Azotobacter beijerinckii]|uniref:Uncharacterized protein n=1 Tax=Azotobacter beijerinckii TaxID=170623 RepID=A0A1H6X865_9GAMM|nr:hypothetical protein [Azotobacter beijerinckii]SEJ24256.1 hypothetical protein SAMN04244579_03630 [Azotobacter beijerinckii]
MRKDFAFDRLVSEGFNVIGVVEQVSSEMAGFFAYIRMTWRDDGAQSPSNLKMIKEKEYFLRQGIALEFIVSDEFAGNAEAGLRAQLLANYSDYVRNSYLSLGQDEARVWIDPKPGIGNVFTEIEGSVRRYLEGLKIGNVSVLLTVDDNLPSDFLLLRLLRQSAPISLELFCDAIVGKGFTVPSLDWLRRKLDAHRRKGYVVWLKGEGNLPHQYALTLKALKALGTEKRRSSPDVNRLLAIASRAKYPE